MAKNRPPNFTPPYVAFEARYKDESKPLVSAFIGIQDRGGDRRPAEAQLRELLRLADGPDVVEQGWHDDVAGARTVVVMAYWRDLARFGRWRGSAAVENWILEPAAPHSLIGRWIETACIRPRALDTLIADDKVHWGLAKLADEIPVTPDHAYWGGTRDRIRISAESELANAAGPALPPAQELEGHDQIVEVTMPENVVVARGGPDWSRCAPGEAAEFRNTVYPAYVRGGRYLRDNAAESGCYSAYLVQETDAEGRDVARNHLIAYFVQLSALERWTRSHPTHLEIYGRFLKMLGKIGRMPDVNLYHEVSVVPAGGLTATYNNCLPATGLLRFGRLRAERQAA